MVYVVGVKFVILAESLGKNEKVFAKGCVRCVFTIASARVEYRLRCRNKKD
jgi:hypothetical protein